MSREQSTSQPQRGDRELASGLHPSENFIYEDLGRSCSLHMHNGTTPICDVVSLISYIVSFVTTGAEKPR